MAESRVFQKVNGVTVDGIGRSVQNFLRSSKGLVVKVEKPEKDMWFRLRMTTAGKKLPAWRLR